MVNEGAKVVWPVQERQVKVPKAKRFSFRNASFLPPFLPSKVYPFCICSRKATQLKQYDHFHI